MALQKISGRNYTHVAGFTLLETLIVLAILTVLASIAFTGSFTEYHQHKTQSTEATFLLALYDARNSAIHGVCMGACTTSASHGVHLEPTQYTLFQGQAYNPTDPYNQVITVETPHTLSGATDIVFERLSGNATIAPTGESKIIIRNEATTTSTITIQTHGGINVK